MKIRTFIPNKTISIKGILLLFCGMNWIINSCALPVQTSNISSNSQRNYPEYYVERDLVAEDKVYDPYIRTVRLYPSSENPSSAEAFPVIPLGGGTTLKLEFDIIHGDFGTYNAKIYSYNSDWTPSDRSPTEYLDVYNEFVINQQEASIRTKVPYIHCEFTVPQVKLSGNYLLVVYSGYDETDLIVSRRFMVYEEKIQMKSTSSQWINVKEAIGKPYFDFEIVYNQLQVSQPDRQLKVLIRQNGRWDQAIFPLLPSQYRDFDKSLVYVNYEKGFQGGTEFRSFDARNSEGIRYHIDSLIWTPEQNEMILKTDRPRKGWVYNNPISDMNGRFSIEVQTGVRPVIEADYVNITFTLKVDEPYKEDVYIIGGFTDWRKEERFRMQFDTLTNTYRLKTEIKQGVYNYMYALEKDGNLSSENIEGSHFQTNNEYEIFVYYRALGGRSDALVGYKRF